MQLFPSLSLLNQGKLFDSLNPIPPPPKTPFIKILLNTHTKIGLHALVSARKSKRKKKNISEPTHGVAIFSFAFKFLILPVEEEDKTGSFQLMGNFTSHTGSLYSISPEDTVHSRKKRFMEEKGCQKL